jgi:hypothetical protein
VASEYRTGAEGALRCLSDVRLDDRSANQLDDSPGRFRLPYSSSGMPDTDLTDQTPDPRDLIRRAFFAARDSGKKADWYQMTAGVLKNRLLLLTSGAFDERDYSANSFTGFLRAFPDLVEVDAAFAPPRVVLKEFAPLRDVVAASRPAPRPRIRPDLWRAVVDFSSGIEYVWDSRTARARPKNEASGEDLPTIPTLTPGELRDWRRSFLENDASARQYANDPEVQAWLLENLSTSALPRALRGPWNKEMSRLLEQRLRDWFAGQKLEPPGDLVGIAPSETRLSSEDDDLRSIAIDVVSHMTADELRRLSFPAEAVLRALRRRV